MTWTPHKCLFFDGRLLWVGAAYALVLIVVLAQPAASLAWLGGAHATIEQATLHEEATEHGHYRHHGALKHHEHRPSGGAVKVAQKLVAWALRRVVRFGR